MSKSILNTRQKILDKSLEMFNERGIEYVGLRELAALLDIRVSNITYYFPTKDDLVYELALELSKKNSELIAEKESLTMKAYLEILHQVFHNHVKFRCLLLSVVHLTKQNKRMAGAYKKTQTTRNSTMKSNLLALENCGYLRTSDEKELDFLVSTISLISRFWISEAAVSFRQMSNAGQISYYLDLITRLLLPYSSVKGKKEIREFLENIE